MNINERASNHAANQIHTLTMFGTWTLSESAADLLKAADEMVFSALAHARSRHLVSWKNDRACGSRASNVRHARVMLRAARIVRAAVAS